MSPVRVGLVGDFDASVTAHQAIPIALELAAASVGAQLGAEWISTDGVGDGGRLSGFDGLWCVPASPYKSMEGALSAIRCAREQGRPFLGTCGGFQHAVLEYARNVLGWQGADHAETAPGAGVQVITPLACPLVEHTGVVRFSEGSRLAAAYGRDSSTEEYRCSYGLNPALSAKLVGGPLRVAARDPDGEVRALELDGHPFFVLTLFQPERAALRGVLPPIVAAFVAAAAAGEKRCQEPF